MRIMCRWQKMARLIVKLYPDGVRPIINVAYKKYHLKVCCRWNKLARMLLMRYPTGKRPIQDKNKTLRIMGNWFKLTMQLLKQDRVEKKWKRIIHGFFNNGLLERNNWEAISLKKKMLIKQLR